MMNKRVQDFRRQFNGLWGEAIKQLEEIKDTVVRSRERLENDFQRLRSERDRLMLKLGEQTYKLAQQGKVSLPSFVRGTVDHLNQIFDDLVGAQRSRTSTASSMQQTSNSAENTQKARRPKAARAKKSTRTTRKAASKT